MIKYKNHTYPHPFNGKNPAFNIYYSISNNFSSLIYSKIKNSQKKDFNRNGEDLINCYYLIKLSI